MLARANCIVWTSPDADVKDLRNRKFWERRQLEHENTGSQQTRRAAIMARCFVAGYKQQTHWKGSADFLDTLALNLTSEDGKVVRVSSSSH